MAREGLKRGNLFSYIDTPAQGANNAVDSIEPRKHTFKPSIKSITSTIGINKDKFLKKISPEECLQYFESEESAIPAERKFGGGSVQVLIDYDDELRRQREHHKNPRVKKKTKIKFENHSADTFEDEGNDQDKLRKQEEVSKLLNSQGVSYLKMKKLKDRPVMDVDHAVIQGGIARADEAQHNRELFTHIVQNNLRGDDLLMTMTKELDQTLKFKEKTLKLLLEENLDTGSRGIFASEHRKVYVHTQIQTEIDQIVDRKGKITSFINTALLQGRTAMLFGDDDESVASHFLHAVVDAGGNESSRRCDDLPLIPGLAYKAAQRRALTPNAAMKRESVRRGIIPFSIKELVASAVKMEKDQRERGRDAQKKRNVLKLPEAELTEKMCCEELEDSRVQYEADDDESAVSFNEHNDIVSINVADYGLGDDKAACLAEAIKLCPNITYLNIQGNRLTDDACEPILKAVLQVGTVRTLVLSNNKLDAKSIDPLRENIARVAPECKARKMKLKPNGEEYAYDMKMRIDRRASEELDDLPECELLPHSAQNGGCSIEDLRLCQSDIDDDECAEFMKALHVNKSLKRLDLSHNLIGSREEECAVFPSFVTGGRAIARMLAVNTTLTDLNLSWNKIRKDSALSLVKCLARNRTITALNISNNNIGDYAVQHLANALRTNNVMTFLDISYNGVLPKGAIVMAHALEENKTMLDCSFEGNCIGEAGGKALLRAMRQAAEKKRQLRINFNNCNLNWEDSTLFDRHDPKQGLYCLHLDDPYEFMIASILFEVYNSSFGALFFDVKYRTIANKSVDNKDFEELISTSTSTAKVGIWEKVELKRPEATGNFNAAWDVHLNSINAICEKWTSIVLKGQQDAQYAVSLFDRLNANLVIAIITMGRQLGLNIPVLIAECISKVLFNTPEGQRCKIHMIFKVIFRVVFRVVDEDQSFSVDEEELSKSLSLLGVAFAEDEFLCLDYARRMIKGVDVDGDKSLNEGEFVRMMLVSYTETIPQSPMPIVDGTGRPWRIPLTGDLQFVFRCEKLPPSLDELQSDETIAAFSANLTNMEGTDEAKEANLALTVTGDSFFSCEQAEMLLLAFPRQKAGTQNSQVIEMFLPQMTTTVEACKFLAQNMTIHQMFDLRRQWGAYFCAITGLATGHYYLDLSIEKDRKAARRLAMLNSLQKNKAQVESTTRDTSQNGDYENYRNGCLNFYPFDCTSYFFAELPLAGKLSFDYVSIARPVPGVEASSTESINNLIERVFHPDLEKYNVAPEFKIEIDAEFAAKLKVEKEAEEAARLVEETAEAKRKQEEEHKVALAAGQSPPRRSFTRKMTLAMQASAEIEKQELAKKLAAKTDIKTKEPEKEKEKAKYVTLQETTAMKKNEENMQIWNSFIDTSYAKFKKANLSDLNEKLMMARIDEGLSSSPLGNPEEEEEIRRQAMQNKIFKDGRLLPVHKSNLALFLKREKQRIAAQIREKEKMSSKSRKSGKNGNTYSSDGSDAGDDFAIRKQLLRRCLSFEHNLNMLEVYLVYNMYLSSDQANAIVQVFIERRAPVEVIVRCICILFSRIVDLENIDRDLLSKLDLPSKSMESILSLENMPDVKLSRNLEKRAAAVEAQRLYRISLVKKEVYHRLGMLNAWSPLEPDSTYELDLAARDSAEVLKILLRLAVIEVGPHIIRMEYAKSVLEPCKLDKFGRWSPPAAWMDSLNESSATAGGQSGLPKYGVVKFRYASVDVPEPELASDDDQEKEQDDEGEYAKAPVAGKIIGTTLLEEDESDDDAADDAFDLNQKGGSAKLSTFISKTADIVGADLRPAENPHHSALGDVEVALVYSREYRQNLDARKELTRLKTLAGAQGTFIEGWVGQTKDGGKEMGPVSVPAKLAPSIAQTGFSFVKSSDIIEENLSYILGPLCDRGTFHDEVNTSGVTKAGEKNQYLGMQISAMHVQEL
jgi:hypothetical protein